MHTRTLAFVIPRYGVHSAGGAEVLCQQVAERLAGAGHAVTVLTTCARDHLTWENHFAAGRETVHGVEVRRFPVDARTADPELAGIQNRIVRGMPVAREEEEHWIGGSVHSAALYDSIRHDAGRFDAFIFLPYLFGTTWAGSAIAPDRSLLIPCLHDEPFARLAIFKEMFTSVRGAIFNSEPERDLAIRLYGLTAARTGLGGMGLAPRPEYRPERFIKKFKLRRPFIMYAGRRESGKNTDLLVEYFRAFKRQNGTDLALVLLGTGDVTIPDDVARDILDLGYVDEQLKHDAYAASLALCQPSINESLSIVLMEAWLAGAGALAHEECTPGCASGSPRGGGVTS
ncbi:MAG: glycosyltransferase family 4 protein [Candidatus Aureabacteria bacterium]|nr:glycosyltransferase family 4 protein [Candidatus Auribacterota bacterium]